MKVGAAYNVFDGEELLLASVRRVKAVADKVVICFSERSGAGEFNPGLGPLLERLEPLVHSLVPYQPAVGEHPQYNEVAMRNVGLAACSDCDVFMSMDCDELYDPAQLNAALGKFAARGADSSACYMQTYYKYADVRLVPPQEHCVPLFYWNDGRRFDISQPWPVLVDPTRRMNPGDVLVFDRSEIEMHHLSHVRRDFRRKLRNSSARGSWHGRAELIAVWHDNWRSGPAMLPQADEHLCSTERVPLRFPDLARFRSPE